MKLTDFKALTFDCYGTLIDWESGMIEGLKPLTSQMDETFSRDEILEVHARHEAAQQAWTPFMRYADILAVVYKRIAEEWGLPVTHEQCVAYGRSIEDWPAFPDSADALRYLKDHYKLIVLSNVDNASFAVSNAKLDVAFDAVFSAEDIGSYKPADRNFDYMLEMLAGMGMEKHDILHTAESMFHDHIPARRQGLATCWIYRRHDKTGFGATMRPSHVPEVEFRYTSMAELADAHRAALEGNKG